MARYFCSDFHFGHVKIVEVERHDCSSIEEHDERILSALEKLLFETDELYFLGDFGWLNDAMAARFRNIKAKKHILLGNHDRLSDKNYIERYGFDEVHQGPFYLTKRIVLSHEPVKVEDYEINIHGHLHNANLSLKNYINTSMFLIGYKPIHEKQVQNLLGTLKRRKPEPFLREWYAHYYRYVCQRPDIILNEDMSINIEKSLAHRSKLFKQEE